MVPITPCSTTCCDSTITSNRRTYGKVVGCKRGGSERTSRDIGAVPGFARTALTVASDGCYRAMNDPKEGT